MASSSTETEVEEEVLRVQRKKIGNSNFGEKMDKGHVA